MSSARKLILRSFQSPGDVVMLTAAVRDLHAAHRGQFETDVRTSSDALWLNNPHITRLQEGEPGVESIDVHYPLVHESNQRPYHFLHGYPQFLEQRLGIKIPVTRFSGDIHLSAAEKQGPVPGADQGVPEHFWIIMAGGKYDFTAKWWNPASYQAIVDHFRGKITFVQCGEAGHWHPPLEGVINLVGKTDTRAFIRLVYHADGIVCPVTFAMHLAAAVETKPGRPKHRPCVVIAGGREPPHWEAYPHHQFLSTVGTLSCCAEGGCWKSRCQPVGDGDQKDRHDLCVDPVQIKPELRIPRCLDMITPEHVIDRIELYYRGGALKFGTNGQNDHSGNGDSGHQNSEAEVKAPVAPPQTPPPVPKTMNALLTFRHGLGDAVQLTIVLKHLQKHRPEWDVDVAALVGKHSAYAGLCRRVYVLDQDNVPCCEYRQRYNLDWHECQNSFGDFPSTKASRCLQEVFQITPERELCRYSVQRTGETDSRARKYLAAICQSATAGMKDSRFPAVLIHYEGNTSAERKNLTHHLIEEVCRTVIAAGYVPVILDWDNRSPLPDHQTIHCPPAGHEVWGGLGTGDAASMASLIEASALMIGVDSGPLHVAGATSTPTIGVWTHHHPTRFFDLADNVLHFVPEHHERFAPGPEALKLFDEAYQHQTYHELEVELPALVESRLTGRSMAEALGGRTLSGLNATCYGRQYYDEHKQAGLDYLGFGDWQRQYGRWLADCLDLKGKRMLEVGCACGSILRGFGEAGVVVQGVDVNEYMIQRGRRHWPDMAPLLFVCDAVNLHLFGDASWDGLHSAQVAEHWKPQLVPFILQELARVTRPGGLFFCAFDTEELFARQGRDIANEDPTHICIKPMSWWHDQLQGNGWQVCTTEFDPILRQHPETFLNRYDWDWFVARRLAEREPTDGP